MNIFKKLLDALPVWLKPNVIEKTTLSMYSPETHLPPEIARKYTRVELYGRGKGR